MTVTHSPAEPDYNELKAFESVPDNYLILSPGLIILTASDDYLQLTGKQRNDISGLYIFDVFPGNGMQESLNQIIQTKQQHELPLTTFTPPGETKARHWRSINKPVLNSEGNIRYIIHRTTEVTAQVIREQALEASVRRERRAAQQSKLLAEQMERLFHDIPAQIAIVRGPNFVYEYINPQYERELFPGRKVLGKPLLEAVPEIKDAPIVAILQKVYLTGQAYSENELMVPLADYNGGPLQQHYFNTVYQPLMGENGEINGILSFKYEVTAHVLARKKLEENERQLQAVNEELSTTNEDLKRTQQSLRQLNTELELRVYERTQQLEQSIDEQHALNEEIVSANEELVSINYELSTIQEQLRQTVDDLSLSEQRFRNLVEDATVGIILLNGPDLQVSIVNAQYAKLIGRKPEELQDKPLFSIIPEAEYIFRPIIEQVISSAEPVHLYAQPYEVYHEGESIQGFLDLVYQPFVERDGKVSGVMVLCHDVTHQVLSRQRIDESEKRFRFLLNAIPQQVWTATPSGTLNYVNDVVTSDLGISGAAIVQQGWRRYFHPDDLPACLRAWHIALEKGTAYQVEFRLLMKDGEYRWFMANAVPYYEDGHITLWLGTNTDISLQKANEQKKDEFLNIASHELRTPLTSIKAYNQLIQKASDARQLTSFMQKSAQHIYRLEKLINDLLDVTRINAGKLIYRMESFAFDDMIRSSVEAATHITPDYELIVSHNDAITYTGDRIRLEQVMHNFLTNAIKYSPEKKQIFISSQVQEGGIVVSVQDFGIGIAENHLDRLFERYYRVDNTAMRFEGLGLGLYISSEILTRHHGNFWIESRPGQGSTFFFRLPLTTPDITPIVNEPSRYSDQFIDITYNAAAARLDVDWIGYQNFETVQRGGQYMLSIMKENGVHKILNDNTRVLGSWSEAADWAGHEWFPMMEKGGLEYFAWICSPSTFSKLSAEKATQGKQGKIVTRLFTDYKEAEEWLDAQ